MIQFMTKVDNFHEVFIRPLKVENDKIIFAFKINPDKKGKGKRTFLMKFEGEVHSIDFYYPKIRDYIKDLYMKGVLE